MGEEFEVHGQHDHAVEHAAHGDALGRWVAMFTALLATLGALISYQNGNSESQGLEFKNEAILRKSEASDQWAYYQAKGIKEVVVENAVAATDAERQQRAELARRYASEKQAIEAEARRLDAEAKAADQASEHAFRPHHRLAQALALVQASIAIAALTVLTRRRWMLGFAGACALAGAVYWALAWL